MVEKEKRIFSTIAYFLGLTVGLYLFAFQVIGFDFKYFPGDLGDGRFNNHSLEHSHRFFTGQQPSFWDAPFMYPEEKTISYSESLVGTAPFYSFFRVLGADFYFAYQLWFILMYVLNYTAAFLFLKWLFKNSYAAVLGSMVFAFSLSLQSQMAHMQVFPRFAFPLIIWGALLFVQHWKPKYFFLSLLALVYQFYCSVYIGILSTVPYGVILVCGMFWSNEKIRWHWTTRTWWLKIVTGALINLGALLILMVPYIQRSSTLPRYSWASVIHTVPTPKSYLFSSKGSLLWDSLSAHSTHFTAYWDHTIFPGVLALGSFIGFLVYVSWFLIKKKYIYIAKHSTMVLIYAATLITFVIFLRVRGITPFGLVFELPGFGALRSVTRVINIELLFMGVAVGLFYVKLAKWLPKFKILIFIGVFVALVFDNYFIESNIYRTEVQVAKDRQEYLVKQIEHLPKGSVISFEPDSLINFPFVYQLDAMIATQSQGMKTVNAYTGTSPTAYSTFWWKLSKKGRIDWLKSRNCKDSIHVIH